MATKTLTCPMNNMNPCAKEKCAWYFGGMCAFSAMADRLMHIQIDTQEIACQLEEQSLSRNVCPFEDKRCHRDCEMYDETLDLCKCFGHKELVNELIDKHYEGFFKKEE